MMRISKEPMTVDQLRRYVNPRFRTIRNDMRALAVDGHSQRFDDHETRIRRLEQLP